MARKYRRRNRRKASVSLVKAIVKKEVNKTRETQKIVSFLGWSTIPRLLDTDAVGNAHEGLILSVMGGISPQNVQTVQTPGTYNDKSLFVLLPSALVGSLAGTDSAGQGGTANSAEFGMQAIGGIHVLEGREAYLKTLYATLLFSNSFQQVVDPRPCFIRLLVIETRRPLSADNVAQQIFLQNHAVGQMAGASNNQEEPQSVIGYLNRESIKRVYYDKLMKLTGPSGPIPSVGGSSAQLKTVKLKVRINKKARWQYFYPTRDPNQTDNVLVYQGPFLYILMCSNQGTTDKFPAVTMNHILTYYDD